MCGIYASFGLLEMQERLDIVTHRGPDGRGWEGFNSHLGQVYLGHRRLAIIDTSLEGLQPMSDVSARYWLTFNGEIYNYIELKNELISLGEIFTTQSDSEVLLRAYMVWGKECLNKLRGMFAFVVWDNDLKTAFIARDRFGIKPLYFVKNGNYMAFGSEIKQLLDLPNTTRKMNHARVYDFLNAGLSDHTSETLFSDVQQLRGGEYCFLDCNQQNLNCTIARWYILKTDFLAPLSEENAVENFNALFASSLKAHLRADVTLGSCLSGGLDSSSIVAMAHKSNMNTVSAVYAEKRVDERFFIEELNKRTDFKSHYVFPNPKDLFAKAIEITWHQDEPFGSSSIFAQWAVFEKAKAQNIKVMLDGQGADELLAGYHSAYGFYTLGFLKKMQFVKFFKLLSLRKSQQNASYKSQIEQLLLALAPHKWRSRILELRQKYSQHGWLKKPHSIKNKNTQCTLKVKDVATLCLESVFNSHLQMLLHWEDRNSMAHSIEARVPFLDHPLAEYLLSLGNQHKFNGTSTKQILRAAMRDKLPAAILERQDKLGFATPEEEWFKGDLKEQLIAAVDYSLKIYPHLFNACGVRKMMYEMLEGKRPFNFSLWRIANLGIWHDALGAKF